MRLIFLILSAICLGVGIGYAVVFSMADTGNLLGLMRYLCISGAGFFFAVIFGIFHLAFNREPIDERNN